jgi:three-Cys-motif partner protein
MKTTIIDFNEKLNPSCQKKCNKGKRLEMTEDGICIETTSIIDGLPVRCVREWAFQKIFHLAKYFGIFTIGMKNKWEGNINYIEICSGLGRCVNRTTGIEFNGTAICIIEHEAFKYVNKAIFIDINDTVIDVLNRRIDKRNVRNAKAIYGDYNKPSLVCAEIVAETNGKGLNLVFIDPTDCSVPFTMLQEITKTLQHVDFIVNFAIGTDVNRNIRNSILSPNTHKNVKEKYIQFLGSDDFYNNPEVMECATKGNYVDLRRLFREAYTNNLKTIGYKYFDFKSIENYYDLVFATSHPKGIEFWRKANAIGYDGQRTLF